MNESEKLDKILANQEAQQELIEKMNRGLYGDEHNKQPGLMQKHYEVEGRVGKLEDIKKKAGWIAGGFILAIEAVKEIFWK